jgi:MtN3 and saliva related transmembrane protein
MRDAIGWASSVLLVLTLSKQVYKQYRSGTSEGVSRWLFVGQLSASLGFTDHSALLGSVVFVVTNGLMVLNALAGLGLWWTWRHRPAPRGSSEGQAESGARGRVGPAASTGAPT